MVEGKKSLYFRDIFAFYYARTKIMAGRLTAKKLWDKIFYIMHNKHTEYDMH
jgi:hypothetical protein